MSIEFKINYSKILVFSNDLKCVYLVPNNKFLDGFVYTTPNSEIQDIDVIKNLYNDIKLKIDPKRLNIITTLPHIEKKWKIDIIRLILLRDEEKHMIKNIKTKLYINDVNDLDNTCFPHLKWLVPLCIDATIYNSSFNQIIIK